MGSENLKDRTLHFVKENLLAVILFSLGMILFVYGLIYLLSLVNQGEKVVFEKDEEDMLQIYVDVEGVIQNPGVYALDEDSRIKDILIASGGLSVDADREWISKNLNLAAKLADGTKVYIPYEGEVETVSTAITSQQGINVNSASQDKLEELPGIGPVTAVKIIDNRPYAIIEELLEKKVVGQKVFDQIKDSISVF